MTSCHSVFLYNQNGACLQSSFFCILYLSSNSTDTVALKMLWPADLEYKMEEMEEGAA